MNKFVKIGIFALIIILAGVFYWRYYFVFSEGVKGGTLNYFEKKGYVFKTWEGRIVQEGFQSPTAGSLQSNEFRFSVQNEALVEQLERASGKFVELRYKEYLNSIPWRGASEVVVYEILEIGGKGEVDTELPMNKN